MTNIRNFSGKLLLNWASNCPNSFNTTKIINGPFLHGLSYQSVWKIFPSVIWEFPLGISIEKMDAEVLFEVEAVGRDLGKIRGSIFSIKIPKENSQITRG